MLDLSPTEQAEIREILARILPEKTEAWVFGSRATSRARRFSDLDLLVRADAPLSFGMLAELEEAFSESDLPFRVDVVDAHRISDEFRAHITAELQHFPVNAGGQ